MKVESRKAGPCRVKLIVNADADETRPEYEKLIGQYVAHGRVPGFRPGHVPRPVIERRYQREIAEDVRGVLVSRFHRLAIEQERLKVAEIVDVTDIIFSPETGVSFVLVVDTVPEFKLPKYRKLPLKQNDTAVSEEQVEKQLAQLRVSLANYEDTESAVAAGDLAQIDYSATCDGKPLAEVVADSGRLAAGADFWARAAEPEFVPGVALALVGLKAGDEKEIKVKFEKDFHLESLRGRKATYQVRVKRVRRAVPPADADLAKRMGFDDLAALRARLRENMEGEAQRNEEARQRQELCEQLLKKCEFDLPQALVAAETKRALRRMLGDLGQRGGTPEYVEQHRDEILGNATTSAQSHVRLAYILGAIADEQQIEVKPEEVNAQIDLLANSMRVRGDKDMTPQKLREKLEENGGLDQMRQEIRNSKTLDWLVADARGKGG